ncbi:MAG: MoxR family ATPase, partial [Gammaproteobacteria bacterium]|nr:MoxR family ATPase [Gammaproteobacteria bacterium]
EAQLDRFLLNTVITYLSEAEEISMVSKTTAANEEILTPVLDAAQLLEMQGLVRQVPVSDHVVKYAVSLAAASRPGHHNAPDWVQKEVKWGAGPRASQALILAGKASALMNGRYTVAIEDIKSLAAVVLRHRIVPSFFAEAEGISNDSIITRLTDHIREPTE